MNQLLLTFDYELFLGGKSGTVNNCLIKPTDLILKLLKKNNLSSIFFVDTIYLYRLKEIAQLNITARNDFDLIINQLRQVIDSKGYVFHHLHPHWLDAVYNYENNEWDLSDKSRFTLFNLSRKELEFVFASSTKILDEIYFEKKQPKHQGIRAGGLYAQPFNQYKDLMLKYNIKFDFSVLKGMKSVGNNNMYKFDYSITPNLCNYRFSNEVNEENINGEFFEFALEQFKMEGLNKLLNSLYYRMNSKKESWQKMGDGKASGNKIKTTEKTNFLSTQETFSIELLNNFKSILYYKQFNLENSLHLISHPKLCSKANIEAFEKFIRLLNKTRFETDVFNLSQNVR